MSWIKSQSDQNLSTQNNSIIKGNSREFTLVIIMLGVLTVLVTLILFVSINPPSGTADDAKIYFQSILDYRKSLLGLILAAFGAWVGAGAAYFFGRENLRESANSLLQLHQQMTGNAKLNLIKVRDIPPKPLDSNFSENVILSDLKDKLNANPNLWFISSNISGKWYILSKESIFQYIQKKLDELSIAAPAKVYSDINSDLMKKTLREVVPDIASDPKFSHFVNQYIESNLEDNAANINKEMDIKGVFLGIVKDEKGELVQYFTTSDIRKALLKI